MTLDILLTLLVLLFVVAVIFLFGEKDRQGETTIAHPVLGKFKTYRVSIVLLIIIFAVFLKIVPLNQSNHINTLLKDSIKHTDAAKTAVIKKPDNAIRAGHDHSSGKTGEPGTRTATSKSITHQNETANPTFLLTIITNADEEVKVDGEERPLLKSTANVKMLALTKNRTHQITVTHHPAILIRCDRDTTIYLD